MVDRHIPYRLVADIASGPMLTYAQKYGATSTDIILNAGYQRAHRYYFGIFKQVNDGIFINLNFTIEFE